MSLVLNVGGGVGRNLPVIYDGWEQHLLDIDPTVNPDICLDAKDMFGMERVYDSVFCSHNLEHFYRHEVMRVLVGFWHVLKPDGFAMIIVPDFEALTKAMQGRDIHDVWYMSGEIPITFHDVIFGWGGHVAAGNQFYCHRTGFTPRSLRDSLAMAGFPTIEIAIDGMNILAKAFKCQ